MPQRDTTTTYQVRHLGDVCGGDHICYLCQSDDEKWRVLSEFYRVGLEKNDKMMYFLNETSAETVIKLLEEGGVTGIRDCAERGQFTARHYSEVYITNGVFTPEDMVARLALETEKCLVEGYSSLRICGDMSWVHSEPNLTSKLIKYESLLNNGFPDAYVALCMYDTRLFKASDMLQVLSTHPQAIINEKFLQNIYYMPPEDYLGADVDRAMLNRWMHNIEERKSIEEQLIASRMEAEKAAHAKSSFLATMSHEIRNPTNGIIGSVDMLAHTNITPDQKEYVNIIQSSAKHLYRVVNDVLDFSKIESGKLELAKLPVKVKELLEDSLRLCQYSIQKNLAVNLRFHSHPSCPGTIIGDETRLRQILVNLIGNACKFTEEGDVVVSVAPVENSTCNVTLEKAKEIENNLLVDGKTNYNTIILEFSVTDSGVGISKKDQSQLFQNFTQIDMSRKWAGTGLGLAICKQLVEFMGGQILVKSVVGQGSTFSFLIPVGILPVSPSHSSASPFSPAFRPPSNLNFQNNENNDISIPISPLSGEDDSHSSLSSSPSYLSSSNFILSSLDFSDDHVLVVDDDVTNQKVLTHMLRKLHCKVTIASNGLEAIRLANENEYTLILTDQYMPECDGYAAIKQIRENFAIKGKRCPTVVVCTGTYEARLNEVMDDILIKPVRFKTIADTLLRYCNNKALT